MTEASPAQPSRYPRGTIILLALAGATVTAFGMRAIHDFLAPVLLTLILTICAQPVRVALEKRGVNHGVATGSVILTVILLLAGFAGTLFIALAQFTAMLPDYTVRLEELGVVFADWLANFGVAPEQTEAVLQSFDPGRILDFATSLLGSVFTVGSALVVIITSLIVMSGDATYIPTVLKQLSARKPTLVSALSLYSKNVRRYMVVTTLLGLAQGALCTIFLYLIGVPAALLWGILLFLCSFIPNIGFFIAIIPPLVFALLSGGLPAVGAVIVYYAVVNGLVQTVIQPRVVSNAVSISQTITFVSVLIWAAILGPLGAILAIPLTLLVRAVLLDADAESGFWSPVIGDITETKRLLKDEDEAAKRARHEAKANKPPKP